MLWFVDSYITIKDLPARSSVTYMYQDLIMNFVVDVVQKIVQSSKPLKIPACFSMQYKSFTKHLISCTLSL